MISVRGLSLRWGEFLLHEIDLELERGSCLALLGPSGAGKSLLLETVMGARKPEAGRVLLDGRDVTSRAPEERGIAYIPQDLALYPHLSVRENVLFGLRPRAARRRPPPELGRVWELLGIEHLLLRRDVRTLSGGERQRVALARALAVAPRVLFLDEPFSALDVAATDELLRSLRLLRRELGLTVFLVTHALDEAWQLADLVAILIGGRIAQQGARDEVLRRPRSIAVARFLGLRNVFPAGRLPPRLAPGLHSGPGSPAAYAIHAEDVLVEPAGLGRSAGARARLLELEPRERGLRAELELEGGLRLEASLARGEARALEGLLGAEVRVRLAPGALLRLAD